MLNDQEPPATADALLHLQFTSRQSHPALFLARESDQLEVTWDETPQDVAVGRYVVEGDTHVLKTLLERAVKADALESFRWASS